MYINIDNYQSDEILRMNRRLEIIAKAVAITRHRATRRVDAAELSAGNDSRTHRKARTDPGREAPDISTSLTPVFESIYVSSLEV